MQFLISIKKQTAPILINFQYCVLLRVVGVHIGDQGPIAYYFGHCSEPLLQIVLVLELAEHESLQAKQEALSRVHYLGCLDL